jgi:hypothetical protein
MTACSFRWFIMTESTVRWFVMREKHCWMAADSADKFKRARWKWLSAGSLSPTRTRCLYRSITRSVPIYSKCHHCYTCRKFNLILKKICTIFISSNKFIKKTRLKYLSNILIMYHKY